MRIEREQQPQRRCDLQNRLPETDLCRDRCGSASTDSRNYRIKLEAPEAPPHFAGHTNPVTGLKNWIETSGPKFVLGQLLLPRSAEVFALSLPNRVVVGAAKLCVSNTPNGTGVGSGLFSSSS